MLFLTFQSVEAYRQLWKKRPGVAAYAKKGNTAGIPSLLIPREGQCVETFLSNYKVNVKLLL